MNSDHLVTLAITLGTSYVCFVIVCWYLYGPLIFNPFELSTLLTIPSEVRIILDFKYREIDFKTAEYLLFRRNPYLRPNDVRLLLSDQAKNFKQGK
jgi:hypothetical protein